MSQHFISLTTDQIPCQEEGHHGHGQGRRGSTHEPLAQQTTTPTQPSAAKASSDPAEAQSDRLTPKPATNSLP
jgi:hypothetical protein